MGKDIEKRKYCKRRCAKCSYSPYNCRKKNLLPRSLFRVPKDNILREKWAAAISQPLDEFDCLCEKHFKKDDMNVNFLDVIRSDQTIFCLPREVKSLKAVAVPVVDAECYPEESEFLPNSSEINQIPTVQAIISTEKIQDFSVQLPLNNEISNEDAEHFSDHIFQQDPPEIYSYRKLQQDVTRKLPKDWEALSFSHNQIIIGKWNKHALSAKRMSIHTDMSVKVYLNEKLALIKEIKIDILSFKDVVDNLLILERIKICPGINNCIRSESCTGYYDFKSRSERCFSCRVERRKMLDRELSKKRRAEIKAKKHKCNEKRSLKNKICRLTTKVENQRENILRLKKNCANMKEEIFETNISSLPKEQQQAVRSCFAAAKLKNNKGRRYEMSWIYECILMRIKSKRLYEHILNRKILAVPTLQTLDTYLKKLNSSYGFNLSIFEGLKEKCSGTTDLEKSGVLLLDEMKLNPCVSFDKQTLKFNGFTDLGSYTPVHQARELGDHALVFMYQPFVGKWVQVLGCFLSKGCANGKVLSHLVIECINLLKACQLSVNAIISDGGQWNRGMWTQFGICEGNTSCEHPIEEDKTLWFLSDFPHLIKNLRNTIVSSEETWLFSEPVYTAMEIYSDKHTDLSDCQSTTNFMRKVSNLIDAMMSRTPVNALKDDSKEMNAITDFLNFLKLWKQGVKVEKHAGLSQSTFVGLSVTLTATLELFDYLKKTFDIKYLMTSRLNQDALERFFGLVREACGSNDHPDSRMFAQIFRLLSSYSLIKPRKGSNVEGSEILKSMLNFSDLRHESCKEKLCMILEEVISNDDPSITEIPTVLLRTQDHDERLTLTADFIQGFIAGYVAFKSKNITKCDGCILSLQSKKISHDEERYKLINAVNRGGLKYPSKELYNLINNIEIVILRTVACGELNSDTFLQILDNLRCIEISKVGCPLHQPDFTISIISFYLIMRSHFITKRYNAIHDGNKLKSKSCRKNAKL